MVKAVPQNTEQKPTITCGKLVFLVKKKKDRVFDRFTLHNLEPDNSDSKSKTIAKAMAQEISKEKVQRMNQSIKNGVTEVEQKAEKDHDFSFLEEVKSKTRKCNEQTFKEKNKTLYKQQN